MKDGNIIILILIVLGLWKFFGMTPAIVGGIIYYLIKK